MFQFAPASYAIVRPGEHFPESESTHVSSRKSQKAENKRCLPRLTDKPGRRYLRSAYGLASRRHHASLLAWALNAQHCVAAVCPEIVQRKFAILDLC